MMTIGKHVNLIPKLRQSISSRCNALGEKIVDKTGNAMCSSGYPATHMLLRHILVRSVSGKNTILPLLCIAAALEIAEELY